MIDVLSSINPFPCKLAVVLLPLFVLETFFYVQTDAFRRLVADSRRSAQIAREQRMCILQSEVCIWKDLMFSLFTYVSCIHV